MVDLEPEYDIARSILEPYRCETGKADLSIRMPDNQIDCMLRINPELTPAKAEQIFLADAFCRAVMYFGGVFLHASAIAFEGKAYLFSAPSKTGKSTHTSLWQQKFGSDRVTFINDDRPIIRIVDGVATVYGGPFSGGTGKECNISVPLGAVFFLDRGEENFVRKLDLWEIAPRFISNTLRYENQSYLERLLSMIDALSSKSDFYELICTPDERAVDCVYKELFYK